MSSYIPRLVIFILFSTGAILSYYFLFPFHAQDSSLTLIYVAVSVFLYMLYKVFTIGVGYEYIEFTPWRLFLIFLLQLFVLCYMFFYINGGVAISSIYLFFTILFYLLLSVGIFLVVMSFGKKLLRVGNISIDKEPNSFQLLVCFAGGFSLFLLALSIVALFGWYTSVSVIAILAIMSVFSYQEIKEYVQQFFSYRMVFENHDVSSTRFEKQIQPYLLSSEFLFFIVTLVVAVGFISVIRPFPIGWDDLGVYMNYPKLISAAGGNIALGQIYMWQLFTGIGFLFTSQTFAFFLNSFSVVLSFFSLYFGMRLLLSSYKKPCINIEFLLATTFVVLPMVVFQVAKDMKLDVGLFALSFSSVILSVYVLFYKKISSQREYYIYVLLIGIILGITFAIKVTSLLLISGILGVLFFRFLSFSGFVSYICLYISIFTFGGLWGMMNVVFPLENTALVHGVTGVFGVIGLFALVYSCFQTKKQEILSGIVSCIIMIIGIIAVLIPWQIKHFLEAGGNVSIGTMISGSSEQLKIDYTEIYSADVIALKEKNISERMSSDGKTQNEDFGRYFGYDDGINNYLKLPWNLSMQVNQKGEFTNITYIFFALIPAIFLFLPYKRRVYVIPIVLALIFEVLYFFPLVTTLSITSFFASIHLPVGYLGILLPLIISAWYLYATLDKKIPASRLFLAVYVFTIFYYFLWSISAFGVVWYGIVMYGCFLLLIGLSIVLCLESEGKNKGNILAFFVFLVVTFYLVQSSVPHALSNLKSARYAAYKTGQVSEHASVFQFHPEYLDILFALNIKEENKQEILDTYKSILLNELESHPTGKQLYEITQGITRLEELHSVLHHISQMQVPPGQLPLQALKKNVSRYQEQFYDEILSPSDENISNAGIYRIGTFLKYFISENHKRIFEDSLLTAFDTYFYDESIEKSFADMKRVGMQYILLDLNAATIDNDPRKDLTRRYENLISGVVSESVKIVRTDSMCLLLGKHKYDNGSSIEDFLKFATVNHTSQGLSAKQKMELCKIEMIEILSNEHADIATKYPFLLPIQNVIRQNGGNITNPNHVAQVVVERVNQGFKILLEIQ